MNNSVREIPYNYTSLSDKEIVLKYIDAEAWDILERLRKHRVTGRSAKLLFEIYGDLFVIDRNPYIYNDLLENKSKVEVFWAKQENRLVKLIENMTEDHGERRLIEKTRYVIENFVRGVDVEKKRRKEILAKLTPITKEVSFSAFDKVSHCTDATDWRIEYPAVVVFPSKQIDVVRLVKAAQELGLKIIARGGGTGLTGGAVPVYRNTMIINTEKLNKIGAITKVSEGGKVFPIITVEAGAVTGDVATHCNDLNYIFATDPTSAWASTLGGNIAENAGGKKAVMWGTCIDNIYSFDIVCSQGDILRVKRKNHLHRKIKAGDIVSFEVFKIDGFGNASLLKTIDLNDVEIHKPGLGKDITNKALGGVPGIQKEGGDGVIVNTQFVVYEPFTYNRTMCLEFYGKNMLNASKAIVDIMERFGDDKEVFLTALEHFDDKYMEVINYNNKSDRQDPLKAALLIDIESNNEDALNKACDEMLKMVRPYDTEGFIAKTPNEAKVFWKDRHNLGAISKNTNGFKINEDIVIPIKSLPEFTDYIDKLNIQKELENNIKCIDDVLELCTRLTDNTVDGLNQIRLDNYISEIKNFKDKNLDYLSKLDQSGQAIGLVDEKRSIFELIQEGDIDVNFEVEIRENFIKNFHIFEDICTVFNKIVDEQRRRQIRIATHMHAGDGNNHVNIPVLSSDYIMMREAHETVDLFMKETVRLGGVVSGEHGIGISKLKYLDKEIIDKYALYKADHDPNNIFNPGKLSVNFPFDRVYTPSFNLLELEAFILTSTDLKSLSQSIANCVRCAKCKPVCNTNYPAGSMFYSPRNKILAVGLIIEAVLYDTMTSHGLSFGYFKKLANIAEHCTGCHKCEVPCPVDIDFGDVTILIRKLMVQRRKAPFKAVTSFTYFYLDRQNYYVNKAFRYLLFKGAYAAQRLGHRLNKPIAHITKKLSPWTNNMLKGRFPKTGNPSLREYLKLSDPNTIYIFSNPDKEIVKTVFYFPGCGSERMLPEISIATVAMLYNLGVRVVMPPRYTCCAYPFKNAGKAQKVKAMVSDNKVMFHKIASMVEYMGIESTVLSCGTCYEMLGTYGLENIFKGSDILDINDFIVKNNLLPQVCSEQIIYHEPCHSPMKDTDSEAVIEHLTGSQPKLTPNCCGDGGTLALSTPEISNTLRERKKRNLKQLSDKRNLTVLTSCPACVQGLSKINDDITVEAKSIIVYLAEKHLGKNWKDDFIKEVSVRGVDKAMM